MTCRDADASKVAAYQVGYEATLPDTAWFQQSLARLGYQVPDGGVLDAPTRRVLAAFQMKYRPARYDGTPDAECAALLQVLLDNGASPAPVLAADRAGALATLPLPVPVLR